MTYTPPAVAEIVTLPAPGLTCKRLAAPAAPTLLPVTVMAPPLLAVLSTLKPVIAPGEFNCTLPLPDTLRPVPRLMLLPFRITAPPATATEPARVSAPPLLMVTPLAALVALRLSAPAAE